MVVVVLLVALLQLAAAQKCLHSGYCSAGKLKPFTGDIHESSAFRAAIAARSYKKELIILVATDERILPGLQTIDNLDKLGIGHVLLISTDAVGCQKILHYVPQIGCVWDSFVLPMVGKDISNIVSVAPLWHTRYRTMARALRLGINVLCTDSDIVLFDDPYRYFKSPPFSDYVVLNQPEVLYDHGDYPGNTAANGGIIYVQNAAPNGPAAWIMAEVIDRVLRWIEDGFAYSQAHHISTGCCYIDQDCLNDALGSALMGRPFFEVTIHGCMYDEWRKEHTEILDATSQALNGKWQFNETVELPQFMRPAAGSNTTDLRWAWIKQPHAHGEWPEKWGGNLYPPKRGNYSLRFQQQLRDDCEGCPLWPDAEDGSPEAIKAADATPPERWLYMPPWLALGHFPRGRLGYWQPEFTGVPQQVIGHAHYIPDTDSKVGKMIVRMMYGEHDWELSRKVAGGPGVFFMSMVHGQELVSGMEMKNIERYDHSVPRLIALHPRIRLDKIAGYEEFMAIVRGLQELATLSGRAVLLPDLPCNLTFMAESQDPLDVNELPYRINAEWFPWGERAKLQCVFRRFLYDNCLYNGRGMLEMEFKQYKKQYGVRYDLEPHSGNTAFIPASLRSKGADQVTNGPAAVIAAVSDAEARAHLEAHLGAQVLYIAHPVAVAWGKDDSSRNARDAVGRRWGECVDSEQLKSCVEGVHGEVKALVPKPRTATWPATMRNSRLHIDTQAAKRSGKAPAAVAVTHDDTRRKLAAGAPAAGVPGVRGLLLPKRCEHDAQGFGYTRHSLLATMRVREMCEAGAGNAART